MEVIANNERRDYLIKLKNTLFLLFILSLAGCDNPLPKSKLTYAGEWQASNMLLIIGQNGQVSYIRKENNVKTSVNGPIKEFIGNNFSVGIGFFSTEFSVSQPPHLVNGIWHMTVDGIILTKDQLKNNFDDLSI